MRFPWWLRGRARRRMEQLHRNGLTEQDARIFLALCRSGRPTPDWLVDRLIWAADTARQREGGPVK